ncbi:MAG TPA: VIT domain-containing protein, partial [Humisphaera sp.]|nr:VIT domain-containing protein [Humisphaera sp.]
MRTLLAAIIISSLFALIAFSQEAQQKIAAPKPNHGAIIAGDDGNPVAGVRLAKADLRAVVHGTLAQATMTLTFANDQPRILGGNLSFPLPEGATVTGYGLDINGQMVDGVAVEKERARIIYETEIHKRVDPGLVEHVAANVFRTRLYPIPANGSRSIKIEYVTQLQQLKDAATLALPTGFGDGIDELSMRIETPEATAMPQVKSGGIDGLTFAPTQRGFVAAASAKKAKCADELTIALPQLPERSVAVEKRMKYPRTIEEIEDRGCPERPHDGFDAFEHYFVITDTPVVARREPTALKNQRVGIVWDASLSRADADHARELSLLKSILNRLGNPGTDLIVLRNDMESNLSFAPDADGTAKLIQSIKDLPYDGATNLGALILPKNQADFGSRRRSAPVPDYDLFLLFTDGFGNIGADRPLKAEVPVYALCDDIKANHALLRSICQESGGSYFNLRRMTDEQALASVGDAPFGLVSIDCKADEIADVYPPAGTTIAGRFTVSGRLLAPEAKVTFNYGYGRTVTSSQTFTISAANASEGSLLPRFWAQQKVEALSQFPAKYADELTALGKRFNLVTPSTSLLVLESVDQYVQYRVVPPPSRPEIYKQFLAQIEQHKSQEAKSQEQKLAEVATMWNGRVQWWEKEYKYPKNLVVAAEGGKGEGGIAAQRFADGGVRPTSQPTFGSDRQLLRSQERMNTPAPSPIANDPARPHLFADSPVAAHSGAGQQAAARPMAQRAQQRGEAVDGISDDRRPNQLAALDREEVSTRLGVSGARFKDAKGESDLGNGDQSVAINIKSWDPKTPYIQAMKSVAAERAYDIYLEQRKAFAHSPAFYFDCADYLVKIGQRPLGIRVLTDIVELELSDARLLRVAAHRLNQIGERELAIDLFEKVLRLRPEEPQSYRDLALALADRADASIADANPTHQSADRALVDYMRALELLNKVVVGNWPRFPEIELPVLMEANDIAAKAQRIPNVHDFHNPIDARLQKNLDLDVRVVMTWDADQTDIDLWVTEPSGEKCYYGHNRTI